MKNLLLADEYSVADDRICPPPTMQPEDLGHLLDTVADRLDHGGVLMLSGTWAHYVAGYQEDAGPQGEPTHVHAGDWSAKVVDGDVWIMWSHTHHKIWTCEVDALEPRGKDTPLIDANPVLTARNFAQWTDVTGTPWVGTPGMTGNGLLIDGWPLLNPKAGQPRWHASGVWAPTAGAADVQWPYGNIEQALTPRQWQRDYKGNLHGYDLNKAYLSAYKVVELAGDALEHRKHQEFDRKRGGIWRVELSPWTYGHLLPDPAGYAPELDDGTRWLTTPTLTLLDDLERRGDYGGFAVRESWTSPARRITRKWADLIDDIAGAARDPLSYAAKQVYKQTYGMWARRTRVYRPDWHYSIIAMNRANLWRKMDKAARYESLYGKVLPSLTQRDQLDHVPYAPVRIETDAVFYEGSRDSTWEDMGAILGFKLDPSGQKLGHFKPVEE